MIINYFKAGLRSRSRPESEVLAGVGIKTAVESEKMTHSYSEKI